LAPATSHCLIEEAVRRAAARHAAERLRDNYGVTLHAAARGVRERPQATSSSLPGGTRHSAIEAIRSGEFAVHAPTKSPNAWRSHA
jgi:hypothetical protein